MVQSSLSFSENNPFPSSSVKVVIRQAKSDDISKIAEVLTYGFHHFNRFTWWLYPLFKMGIAEDLRDRIYKNDPHYRCLIAVQAANTKESEKVIGTLELSLKGNYSWTKRKQYSYISNLAVKEGYRRQGIATKLLQESEKIAQHWGFDSLSLHVLAENKSGLEVYLQNGYVIKQVEIDLYSLFITNKRRLLLEKKIKK